MKNPYVLSRFAEVEAAINKMKPFAVGDVELHAFFACYLVVLICGVFEDCTEYLVGERAAKSGDKEVENFVREVVAKYFRSPKFEYISNLMLLFSDSYKKTFDGKVDTKARAALGSIVTHRISVAHGKTSNVTLGEVENYYASSKPIFDALEQVLG